jgi:tRNA threonylcarbamoyladenosine biosynthesis protein TsaB
VLAVETSSLTGSAALALGPRIIAQRKLSGPLRHNAELFEAVRALLKAAGLKPFLIRQVYISAGPGSFTGLRIAVTMAKIMNLACSARIVTVNSLDAVAANAICGRGISASIDRIAAVVDARRGYFYAAVYEKRHGRSTRNGDAAGNDFFTSLGWEKTAADRVTAPQEFTDEFAGAEKPLWLLGEALLRHKDRFAVKGARFLDRRLWGPTAAKVHLLGRYRALAGIFADAAALQPTYLCPPPAAMPRRLST